MNCGTCINMLRQSYDVRAMVSMEQSIDIERKVICLVFWIISDV